MLVDYRRDRYLSDFSHKTLEDRYLIGGETSPQDAFARAAEAFSDNDEHAQRLYDYASKLWFMFSTPVLSNGGTERGMPISCFLNHLEDSRGGITSHYTENAFLSSVGGGIGGLLETSPMWMEVLFFSNSSSEIFMPPKLPESPSVLRNWKFMFVLFRFNQEFLVNPLSFTMLWSHQRLWPPPCTHSTPCAHSQSSTMKSKPC